MILFCNSKLGLLEIDSPEPSSFNKFPLLQEKSTKGTIAIMCFNFIYFCFMEYHLKNDKLHLHNLIYNNNGLIRW